MNPNIKNLFNYKKSKCILHILLKENLITQKEYYNTLNNLAKEYKIKDDSETKEE